MKTYKDSELREQWSSFTDQQMNFGDWCELNGFVLLDEPMGREPLYCKVEDLPELDKEKQADMVNHPPHYTQHPSGVECITITQEMGFVLGNALKYIWRADLKNGIEDLEKAKWYIEREIARRKKAAEK